jgi:hypothetical protein
MYIPKHKIAMTVTEKSDEYAVFYSSNIGIVGSNPIRDMDV